MIRNRKKGLELSGWNVCQTRTCEIKFTRNSR